VSHLPNDFDRAHYWQAIYCFQEMQNAGVPEALLEELPRYLAEAEPRLTTDGPPVLLHGDLDAINLLIEEQQGAYCISSSSKGAKDAIFNLRVALVSFPAPSHEAGQRIWRAKA